MMINGLLQVGQRYFFKTSFTSLMLLARKLLLLARYGHQHVVLRSRWLILHIQMAALDLKIEIFASTNGWILLLRIDTIKIRFLCCSFSLFVCVATFCRFGGSNVFSDHQPLVIQEQIAQQNVELGVMLTPSRRNDKRYVIIEKNLKSVIAFRAGGGLEFLRRFTREYSVEYITSFFLWRYIMYK